MCPDGRVGAIGASVWRAGLLAQAGRHREQKVFIMKIGIQVQGWKQRKRALRRWLSDNAVSIAATFFFLVTAWFVANG